MRSNADGAHDALLAAPQQRDEDGDLAASADPMRFWIVFVLVGIGFIQAAEWNIFGPIQGVANEVYGWSAGTVAMLENTANFAMLAAILPSAYAADRFGLRLPTVACGAFVLSSSLLRLLPLALGLDPRSDATLAIMYVSMFLNGCCAAWPNFAGPNVSTTWFPVSERATATSVCSVAPFIGVAVGFVWAGSYVREDSVNKLDLLHRLYGMQAAIAVFFVMCLAYRFPAQPALPPSHSAAQQAKARLEAVAASTIAGAGGSSKAHGHGWRRALATLLHRDSARLWLVALTMTLPLGVFSGWSSVLDVNVAPLGISQSDAGWLGCFMTLAGCTGGVAVGRIADAFHRRLKRAIVVCYALSGLSFLWFAFACTSAPHGDLSTRTTLYVSGILGGLFVNCAIPLGFELAAEEAFPRVAAGMASGLLCVVNTLTQIAFLAVTSLQSSSDYTWMNWATALAAPAVLVPLACFKPRYNRLDVDLS